ncbi:MAG: hypothetical protein KAW12_19695 [Candidatus Aminicenantes bacterium]|nr:hypothetical protein [Candidatus Aminicenantes bacterium]
MSEQPSKLFAWSELLKSISKILWVLVVIILLVGLGKTFIFKADKKGKTAAPVKKPVVEKVDWSKVNQEIAGIMETARKQAEKEAAAALDKWIAENMKRVDEDFLEWYFGYWTQQKLGIQALLSQVWHWVDSDSPSAAETITLQVQREFSNRVIRPVIAQSRVERIVKTVVAGYTDEIRDKIEKIPEKYEIRQADWDRYIDDISVLVTDVEANRQVSLPLKTIVAAAAGGTVLAARVLKPVLVKIGSKISTKLAAKSAAKMAAKTGGKVVTKTGGKFLGTIVAVGIIIWDVWDHYSTKKKAKPVLRRNIHDYFTELKQSILHDPEYGIITVIYGLEQGISKSIK